MAQINPESHLEPLASEFKIPEESLIRFLDLSATLMEVSCFDIQVVREVLGANDSEVVNLLLAHNDGTALEMALQHPDMFG